ncbi:putative long-chain-fatty-acid--CoA ligase [Rodentibacter pneumotropicus]|uniref:Putative long-chain-fatty-acid--CoA ligase n=1 Tax=Rodentibacter pneumotropicus TaxID=758 RepID=A0A448MSP8_9PAST|nr:putative long-chain-fatty-acid--CoA ligase [Rodentibacter pneumotropicus]
MKTSNGKYIAPQYIESKIGKDKFIDQIAIVADAKNMFPPSLCLVLIAWKNTQNN